MRDGHTCVVYDVSADAVEALEARAPPGRPAWTEFVASSNAPRAAWVMVPAAYTGDTVEQLADVMSRGRHHHRRRQLLLPRRHPPGRRPAAPGIHFVDVGTSGASSAWSGAICLMIGGEADVVGHLDPIFKTIAPGVEAAPRSEGRRGPPATSEQGYLHCGPHGAGHFVKMVHNGIEYGLMAAYAEGLAILHKADVGLAPPGTADAETAPLSNPEYYQYEIDTTEVAEVWRRGSVISSWLLDLTAHALLPGSQAGRVSGPGLRLRRGAVDGDGGHRRSGAGPRTDRRPLRAVLVPGRSRFRRPRPVGHAQGVRRARRAGNGLVAGPDPSLPVAIARLNMASNLVAHHLHVVRRHGGGIRSDHGTWFTYCSCSLYQGDTWT